MMDYLNRVQLQGRVVKVREHSEFTFVTLQTAADATAPYIRIVFRKAGPPVDVEEGDPLYVVGELRQHKWTDKAGTMHYDESVVVLQVIAPVPPATALDLPF